MTKPSMFSVDSKSKSAKLTKLYANPKASTKSYQAVDLNITVTAKRLKSSSATIKMVLSPLANQSKGQDRAKDRNHQCLIPRAQTFTFTKRLRSHH